MNLRNFLAGRRLTNAALACPVCAAPQPPCGTPRLWQCAVCKCPLVGRYDQQSPEQQSSQQQPSPQPCRRTKIVALDHWARNNLFHVVMALAATALIGVVRSTTLATAFSVCAIVFGTSVIVEAAAVIRHRAAIERATAKPARHSLFRSAVSLLYGCWVLCSGVVLFHLSLGIITITDQTARRSTPHLLISSAAPAPRPSLPHGNPHP